MKFNFKPLMIWTFLLVFAFGASAYAQTSQLGKVDFPTSGAPKAQEHFLRGLAALHSFWFEEALDAFQESTRIDPDFMMGYWGEAMSYNHPLWSEQDTPAGRAVVAKIKDTPKLDQRERAYLNAVRALYGEGDKHARDQAYSAAMEKIYHDYPDDLDAAAFYALSLLGVGPEDKSYRVQARAGAIALEVYQRNPNHPGAAHYIIHAFDDPDHAILALPAARRYASIAPEAHHARHMPSHIFLQLGMWPEAAASNESAWQASDEWMKRKHLSTSVRDYHSLHWLLYVYLQQGRYHKAEELLTLIKQTMSEGAYDNKLRPGYFENSYANMAAAFVVETERWNLATALFPSTDSQDAAGMVMSHGAHGPATATTTGAATLRTSSSGRRLPLFIRGMAESWSGSGNTAEGTAPNNVNEFEVAAVAALTKKDYGRAIELMKKAVAMEEEMGPPSGPPGMIKPANELFGEILLKAGKPQEATAQFKAALLRQPNRARSLIGLARAAAQSGDKATAASVYAKFLEQWQLADKELPELKEAREYVGR
ncbi:MAG TPA: tetratricopeptide repeat protein [Pyrinomonadaceae bacterium]|nr:tetratricopeptide repeat protein [Pyrinomonadaceae bacterium]